MDAENLISESGKGDLIISNNVFAHVPDVNDFTRGVKNLLADEGVFCVEVPYIYDMISGNKFDTIYHEHYSYYSLYTLVRIMDHHDLKVIDVERLGIHGGSLRVYATHSENFNVTISRSVKELLDFESRIGVNELYFQKTIGENAKKIKNEFLNKIREIKKSGKYIAAYGAAAKGNTFLNYCQINQSDISKVYDKAHSKVGNILPGTHIPICDPSEIKADVPDYIIILPSNLKDEIVKEVRKYNPTAKFIVIFPTLEVV